jgi:hypothetical protein
MSIFPKTPSYEDFMILQANVIIWTLIEKISTTKL